ncbi:hypothetical protein [Microbacterium telephonicum]|uniref:Uncharacterized protein n=1 Tax=Microbacterium telephonicum TaxID=1714841 RepID=A0A498CBQ6_9MICO|nr:hypothetical protein [Microbacterium telephonicum]RLK52637.1 hypothetical protein C7474_0590 [Microbacterium telephonicum]
MKRIDIEYGGRMYSVGGREPDEVMREIEEGIESGHHWLRVNDGEGMRRDALLLVTPGVPIAVVPIPGEPSVDPDPRPYVLPD